MPDHVRHDGKGEWAFASFDSLARSKRLAHGSAYCQSRQVKDVSDLADEVEDERAFIAFLDALARDFACERAMEGERPYSSGALGWEHGSIDSMLDAAAAWGASSSEGWQAGEDRNPWRRCARIILAGKLYE